MTAQDLERLTVAIREFRMVTLLYRKGGKAPITRHVRPYELSFKGSRTGPLRPVLWGTDSLHGPRRIHCFRQDRIVSVALSERAKEFRPAVSITKYLDSYEGDFDGD